jgi:hypothetical protein
MILLLALFSLAFPCQATTENSGLFVSSNDLCGPLLADCASASPCYDHAVGICDADTGVMSVVGQAASCAEAKPWCGGCFPNSLCGSAATDKIEVVAGDGVAGNNPTLDVSPDALASLGASHTCISENDDKSPRCFYTFVPECAGENSPLVFDIHGYGSSPLVSSYYTGWAEKAAEYCFVLVMPLVSRYENP